MTSFQRHRPSGAIIATLRGVEADLLRALASQLIELLHNERAVANLDPDPLAAALDFSGPTTPPDDPVLARLFPSAYDDEDDAGEFRRFTEGALRDGKAAGAATIIDSLAEAGLDPAEQDLSVMIDVELDRPTAETWLRSLTDIRLALGVRLGVQQDDADYWDSLPEEDPRVQVHDLFEWLGLLQESLIRALSH